MNAGLKPRDIDFLVLNCSLFNPTPSLTAMVINHFKMRSDIISYNLGGESGSGLKCLLSLPQKWLFSTTIVLFSRFGEPQSLNLFRLGFEVHPLVPKGNAVSSC